MKQTFPSIDFSLVHKDDKKKHSQFYHCSVSLDKHHFARTINHKGHLPVDLPTQKMLRSDRAKSDHKIYFDVLQRVFCQDCDWDHKYAVIDQWAVDLQKPTPPFANPYYIFSENEIEKDSKAKDTKAKTEDVKTKTKEEKPKSIDTTKEAKPDKVKRKAADLERAEQAKAAKAEAGKPKRTPIVEADKSWAKKFKAA